MLISAPLAPIAPVVQSTLVADRSDRCLAAGPGSLAKAVHGARSANPELAVEVECRNLDEVSYALGTGADLLLLDNMDTETLREAVRLRDENSPAGKGPSLEASGGVSLETARAIAETGVDLISVGALTHSAPSLDFSLLIEPAKRGGGER